MSSHQEEKASEEMSVEESQAETGQPEDKDQEQEDEPAKEGEKFDTKNRRSLGLVSVGLGSFTECIKDVRGVEPRMDVTITNCTSNDIYHHFQGDNNREVRELLQTGVSRIYSKRPKDGLTGTTNYECEFWQENKHAKIFVYGLKAPRKNNKFEVTDEGFYLIKKNGSRFLVARWMDSQDQPDHQGASPGSSPKKSPGFLTTIKGMF